MMAHLPGLLRGMLAPAVLAIGLGVATCLHAIHRRLRSIEEKGR